MLAQFDAAKRADDGYVEEWKKLGHKYIELTDEEMASLRRTVRQTLWPQMEALIGADLLQLVRQNASAE